MTDSNKNTDEKNNCNILWKDSVAESKKKGEMNVYSKIHEPG